MRNLYQVTAALANGIPILSEDWLAACDQEGGLADAKPFSLNSEDEKNHPSKRKKGDATFEPASAPVPVPDPVDAKPSKKQKGAAALTSAPVPVPDPVDAKPTALKVVANGPFKDKVVVFTGTLESLTRDKATYHVEKAGGRVAGSVSGNSDFVVVSAGCGQKLDDALWRGVDLLDEAEFLAGLELGKTVLPVPVTVSNDSGAVDDDHADRVLSSTTEARKLHTAPLARLCADKLKTTERCSVFLPVGLLDWPKRESWSYGVDGQGVLEIDRIPASVRLVKTGLDGKEKFVELKLQKRVNMHSAITSHAITMRWGRSGSFGGWNDSRVRTFLEHGLDHDAKKEFKKLFEKLTGNLWSHFAKEMYPVKKEPTSALYRPNQHTSCMSEADSFGSRMTCGASYYTAPQLWSRMEIIRETFIDDTPDEQWVTITPERTLDEVVWAAKAYPGSPRIMRQACLYGCAAVKLLLTESATFPAPQPNSFYSAHTQHINRRKSLLDLLGASTLLPVDDEARQEVLSAVNLLKNDGAHGLGASATKTTELGFLSWAYMTFPAETSLQATLLPKLRALFEKDGDSLLDSAELREMLSFLRDQQPEEVALRAAITSKLGSSSSLAEQLKKDIGKTLEAMQSATALRDIEGQVALFNAFAVWEPSQQHYTKFTQYDTYFTYYTTMYNQMFQHAITAVGFWGKKIPDEIIDRYKAAQNAGRQTEYAQERARTERLEAAADAIKAHKVDSLRFPSPVLAGKPHPLEVAFLELLLCPRFIASLNISRLTACSLLRWLASRVTSKQDSPMAATLSVEQLVKLLRSPSGFAFEAKTAVSDREIAQVLSEVLPCFPTITFPAWFSDLFNETKPASAPVLGTLRLAKSSEDDTTPVKAFCAPNELGARSTATIPRDEDLQVVEQLGDSWWRCLPPAGGATSIFDMSNWGFERAWIYSIEGGANIATFTEASGPEPTSVAKESIPPGVIGGYSSWLTALAASENGPERFALAVLLSLRTGVALLQSADDACKTAVCEEFLQLSKVAFRTISDRKDVLGLLDQAVFPVFLVAADESNLAELLVTDQTIMSLLVDILAGGRPVDDPMEVTLDKKAAAAQKKRTEAEAARRAQVAGILLYLRTRQAVPCWREREIDTLAALYQHEPSSQAGEALWHAVKGKHNAGLLVSLCSGPLQAISSRMGAASELLDLAAHGTVTAPTVSEAVATAAADLFKDRDVAPDFIAVLNSHLERTGGGSITAESRLGIAAKLVPALHRHRKEPVVCRLAVNLLRLLIDAQSFPATSSSVAQIIETASAICDGFLNQGTGTEVGNVITLLGWAEELTRSVKSQLTKKLLLLLINMATSMPFESDLIGHVMTLASRAAAKEKTKDVTARLDELRKVVAGIKR